MDVNKSIVIKVILISLTLLAATLSEAKLNCSRFRSGYKCIATDQDGAERFKGIASNTYLTDVKMDSINIVDTCERIRNPPPPRPNSLNKTKDADIIPSPDRKSSRWTRTGTALEERFDRGLAIKKGENITISMERIKAPGYCSMTMIKNCRTLSNTPMDCSQMISIS